jgi:hypothetical protein
MATWIRDCLFIAAGLVLVLGNLPLWATVALVAVFVLAGTLVAGIQAWQFVRLRALELAALASDEQAARLLGEAIRRCGPHVKDSVARELWDTFAALPSDAKRALALAIVGFVGDSESYELATVGPKLVDIVRSFRAPVDVP